MCVDVCAWGPCNDKADCVGMWTYKYEYVCVRVCVCVCVCVTEGEDRAEPSVRIESRG